jgi:hypothetical protein
MARPVGGRGAPIDGPSVMKRLRDGGGWPLEKEGQPTAGVVGGKLVHRLMGNKLGNPVQDPELVTIDSPLLKRPTRSGVAGGCKEPNHGRRCHNAQNCVHLLAIASCDVPGSQRKKLFVGQG